MALDEMNNAMPPEELNELNEKNLEGRIEWSCWENQQRKNKIVVYLSKQFKTWGEIIPQPKVWISKKNEEMQNSTSEEKEELFALRDARRKDTWTPPTKFLMNTWRMN